ncbi:MAG TPA: EF-hand domain-containing protein [Blastocatellia bacterium]|jgi:Ca2+-binding EF-hand superfamily protein|nr:EF-hand domain-containing protein [Blastocatellia bacterium]
MKHSVFALFLTIGLLATTAFPQTESPGQRRGRHNKGKLLQRSDANGDGQISRDEWKGRPRGFERLDRNHDGTLTRDEAEQAARDRAEHRRKAIEQADKNGDGQINREEWQRRPEVFDRLDQNRDGVLTREELAAGRRHKRPQ